MFNFKELKIDRRANLENFSSFVGIRRTENMEYEFRLPRGFDDFPENDFNATKQLFFRMYRTFKKFEQDRRDDGSLLLDDKSLGKDNIETGGNAYRFKDKEDSEVLLYSKISVIENLLETYKDLAIDVIERRIGLNEKIDYSKIDKYIHKAIYLLNDVIYIDEMDLPRQTLQYGSATLIDLFCFILYELKNELEENIDDRVKDFAIQFKEYYLSHDQSLFNEETFETTIAILKDILDDINKRTAYKDDDYWRLYDAIESFLYGELDMKNTHEDGVFWGINNFYQIWEDMCHTYAFSEFNQPLNGLKILFADTNIIFNGKRVSNYSINKYKLFKEENFINQFFIEFREQKRWMRPDLIRIQQHNKSFKDFVSIRITRDNGRYVDFSVQPIDKISISKEQYKIFCSNLKTSIKNGHFPSRPIGDNTFKQYPKEELEKRLNTKIFKNAKDDLHILDWKYMDISNFLSKSLKLENDINKQICYEFVLQGKKVSNNVKSHFVIPYFYSDPSILDEEIGDYIDDATLYHRLRDNDIRVFKANFLKIQSIYLSHAQN